MADEQVDIIDESGTTVDSVMKSKAHEQGLLHKTVVSEVINSEGKWLMVKQASDRQDAGQYVSPVGGHVKAGESDIDALKREAEEEIGLTRDFTYEYVGSAVFNRFVIGRQENHLFVMYKIFSDSVPTLNEESVEYQYFTLEELRKEHIDHPEKFGDAFRFVIEQFFPELK